MKNEMKLVLDMLQGTFDGGEGSGNFGHAGRPGKVGGSAPEGGGAKARAVSARGYSIGYKEGNMSHNRAKAFAEAAPEGTKITMSVHNTGDYVGEYEKKNGIWVGSQKYRSDRVKPPLVKTSEGFAMQVVGNDIEIIK